MNDGIVSVEDIFSIEFMKPKDWMNCHYSADLELLKIWNLTIALETIAVKRIVGNDILTFVYGDESDEIKEQLVRDMQDFTLYFFENKSPLKMYESAEVNNLGVAFMFTKEALTYLIPVSSRKYD